MMRAPGGRVNSRRGLKRDYSISSLADITTFSQLIQLLLVGRKLARALHAAITHDYPQKSSMFRNKNFKPLTSVTDSIRTFA